MSIQTDQRPPIPPIDLEPQSAIRAELHRVTLQVLPRIAVVSGLGYLVLTAYARLMLPPEIASVVMTLSVVSAMIAFIVLGALRAWPLEPRYAPPTLAVLMGLALLNGLYPLYLTGDPRYTTALMLVIVAAGLAFLTTRWFALLVVAAIAGWIAALPQFASQTGWQHFGASLLLAVAVAIAVHVVRRKHCERIVVLELQNSRQHKTIQRYTTHTETSIAVGYRISAVADLDALLNQVVEIIRVHYGYTYAGIFLLDEKTAELVASAGTGSAGRAAIQSGTRIKLGRGIVGWVGENRRVAYARDTTTDPRFVVWDLRSDTRSELTLPLHLGERLIGVLDLQSDQPHAFPKDDVTALQLLADHVARAIQNARSYKTDRGQHRFTETLHHIGRALSRTLDQQEALNLILRQLSSVIPHDRGAILLQNGNMLDLVAVRGFPQSHGSTKRTIPIRPGDVFDEIRRTQRPLGLDDALQRTDWFHLDDLLPARSWMGVPLIYEDTVIGMLSLARETHAPYTEDEIAFAAVFAWQATIALENARLCKELSHR